MSTELATLTNTSPFEGIKHADPETGETYWLAREMHELAGYAEWRDFDSLIRRAITVCEEVFPGQPMIVPKHNQVARGFGGTQLQQDYRLTRYGALMTLSRSDKPELADYFVVQTMYAENAQRAEVLKLKVAPEPPNIAQALGAKDLRQTGVILRQIAQLDPSVQTLAFTLATSPRPVGEPPSMDLKQQIEDLEKRAAAASLALANEAVQWQNRLSEAGNQAARRVAGTGDAQNQRLLQTGDELTGATREINSAPKTKAELLARLRPVADDNFVEPEKYRDEKPRG